MKSDDSMSLGRMLEIDLNKIQMLQRELVVKLLDGGEPPITEQAISNWKRTGRIPRRRVDKLIEILGPDSLIAKAYSDGHFIPGKDDKTAFQSTGSTQADHAQMMYYMTSPSTRMHNQVRTSPIGSKIRELVTEELWGNFDIDLRIGDISTRFQYMSNKAVIRFCQAQPKSLDPQAYRHLFKLALARKISKDGRAYGLIMVMPALSESANEYRLEPPSSMRRLTLEASIMGVRAELVDDYRSAAKMVERWERKEIEEEEEEEEELE